MNDRIKSIILVLSGFLTLLLSFFVPVGGGGISIILVLTIPILIGLGIIFGTIHYFIVRKMKNIYYKKCIFLGMLFLIIILTFLWYPYN